MRNTLENTLKDVIVTTLDKHITLVKRGNSIYADNQEFLVWSWAGVNQISVQQASEELCDCGYDVPSGDAVLDRLSKQPYKILEYGFHQVFKGQVSQARKQRLFTHAVIVAIDFTDIEWYGEELPFIVKGKAKKGTDRFIRYATIGIVEDGKRFTLKVLPVTPLSCKEKIVTAVYVLDPAKKEKERIEMNAPSAKNPIIPVKKHSFKNVYPLWDGYIKGKILRKEIRDITRHSKYIISTMHQFENLMYK